MSSGSRRIWFIRHGERLDFVNPHWPDDQQYPYDSPLSEDGILQAENTAHFLREEPLAQILSSPFQRTLQTAAPFADEFGLPLCVEHGLSEVFFQRWFPAPPILPNAQSRVHVPIDETYYSQVFPIYPETDESITERARKMALYLGTLAGDIACVTHGGVLWHLIAALTGKSQAIEAGFCCLISVVWRNGTWELERDGSDDSHLEIKDRFHRIA